MTTPPSISASTAEHLQRSWARIVPRATEVAAAFYERLFALDDRAGPLFGGTDMVRQRERLVESLGAIVRAYEDTDTLLHMAAALGRRHVGYGVQSADYDVFAHALTWAFDETPGVELSAAERAAWTEAVALFASVMRRAGETS